MSVFGTTKELAERACVWLNANPLDDPARPTTRYVVERYADPNGKCREKGIDYAFDWGVVRKWRYADRPDLDEFGGAFTVLTGEMIS